jgi:hypothetical protein
MLLSTRKRDSGVAFPGPAVLARGFIIRSVKPEVKEELTSPPKGHLSFWLRIQKEAEKPAPEGGEADVVARGVRRGRAPRQRPRGLGGGGRGFIAALQDSLNEVQRALVVRCAVVDVRDRQLHQPHRRHRPAGGVDD